MDFDPQKLFIDVIDFFSILLPGALLTYLFKDSVGPHVLGYGYCYLHGTEGWVVFVFSSYLLGHFLFFIGSWLDDFAYDPLRGMTNKEQITRLLNGRTLSPKVFRWLALLCFKRNADSAVDRVVLIKRDYLNRIDASRAVNAFQWCKARLATERPAALAAINRFEADSKFFRSFVPVMLIVLGTAVYERQWPLAAGSIGAMLLAFVRYMEQRFKSTQHAYWNLLTLEASAVPSWLSRMPLSASNSDAEPPPPTHAGGVVVRKHRSKTEYLLLQATTDPEDWVLPKGHIELGEDARRCAIREVKEETGVWARIRAKLRVSEYKVEGKAVRVQFYLMEVVDRGRQEDPLRKHKWLSFDKALESTEHQEVKELLIFADQLHVV